MQAELGRLEQDVLFLPHGKLDDAFRREVGRRQNHLLVGDGGIVDAQAAALDLAPRLAVRGDEAGFHERVQNADTRGMHARTFTLDSAAALLVAANQNAVTKPDGTRVPASLSVFRIADNGILSFLKKYDVETGQGANLMWAGFVRVKS